MLNLNLRASVVAATVALFAVPAVAGPTPLTANIGWIGDDLMTAGQATLGSPFTFTLVAGKTASFKVTDNFATGDSFDLFVNGSLLSNMSSTAYVGAAHVIVGDSFGEQGWLSGRYEKFEYVFADAGDYSFVVRGDGVGGVPAGYYFRLDVADAGVVPEPATLALVSLALAGAGAASRRRVKR